MVPKTKKELEQEKLIYNFGLRHEVKKILMLGSQMMKLRQFGATQPIFYFCFLLVFKPPIFTRALKKRQKCLKADIPLNGTIIFRSPVL